MCAACSACFPPYTPAFATFEHAYALMGDVRASCRRRAAGHRRLSSAAVDVRFIDENIAPAKSADFAWADIVFVSGMHVQAPQINDIDARAKAAGKISPCSADRRCPPHPTCIPLSTTCISAKSATRRTN
jgi:hypothetical protein